MASSADTESGDPGFQIAPMVDVVFVLMLFFMASAGLKMRELELPITATGSGNPDLSPVPAIVIEIRDDGLVSINKTTYAAPGESTAALRTWLAEVVAQFGIDDPVIIRPAANVRHERIMQVLGDAHAAGVKKITFG